MTAGNLVRQSDGGGSAAFHPPAARAADIRIGILCHGRGSGSTRAAIDLAQALHRRGIAVMLVTLGCPRWKLAPQLPRVVIAEPDLPLGVEARWPGTATERLALRLLALCRAHQLTVLHYHYAFPFAEAAARLAAMASSPPHVVATLHGGDIARAASDEAARDMLTAALSSAGAVATVSQAYAGQLQALTGRACLAIPNFLPAERRPQPRAHHVIGRELTLVHVSNFRAVKNVQDIGRVFLTLRRSRNCRLLLAGDGPHRPALQMMLHGCAGAVRFFGMLEDVHRVVGAADVMLLASHAESFSLAALEAMSAGVPVIAPRIAGLSETVIDGSGGVLYTPSRPQDAVRKLLRLCQSPNHYRRLARGALSTADSYTEDATAGAYLALYHRLAAA